MFTPELLESLKVYTAKLETPVTVVLQTGEHPKRAELVNFLKEIVSTSSKLELQERDLGGQLRSPVSFTLESNDTPTGIVFSGIPGGHEFNSLVLALLHTGGVPVKLDANVVRLVGNVEEPLQFEVVVSLSCHNCPDVVQTLNQFATLNPRITTKTIDGALYPELIDERNIQGVPTVFLNGEVFANGKVDPAQILDRLLERYPHAASHAANASSALPLQDVTVIGSGPAGVSAAIYAARKGLSVTVIGDRFGGQLKDTMGIENLISVPKTTGPELSNALQAHLDDYTVSLKEHLRVANIVKGDPHVINQKPKAFST